jgi:hypothetical protein
LICHSIKDHSAYLSNFGDVENIGCHSVRKGAATYCASGSTVAPPIVSICLRAGWAISGSKERYLKYENAGDQFVSRMVCGLNANSYEFAISPPYFETESDEDTNRINTFFERTYPDLNFSPNMALLAKMYLASICYHHDWFVQQADVTNPFLASLCFNNISPPLRQLAVVKYPWSKTAQTPSFTGIPPHVTMLTMLKKVSDSQDAMPKEVVGDVIKELDDRGTLGGFNENRMRGMITEMTERLSNEISSTTTNNNNQETNEEALRPNEDEADPDGNERRGHRVFHYNGAMHYLPQSFEFPRGMNLKAMMSLFLVGMPEQQVPPLRILNGSFDVMHLKRGKQQLADMRFLMKTVETEAKAVDPTLWVRRSLGEQWDIEKVNNVYYAVWRTLDVKKQRRFHSISWSTIVRNLYFKKRQDAAAAP